MALSTGGQEQQVERVNQAGGGASEPGTMDGVLPRLREISGNNRSDHFGQTSNQQVSQPG